MEIKTKIRGLNELNSALKLLGPRIATRVGDAGAAAGAREIARRARTLVPVRSGELKQSIVVVRGKRAQRFASKRGESTRSAIVGIKKPTSRRAHLTEFGTRFAPAQPFLRPAIDGAREEIISKAAQAMRKGVLREAKKVAKPLR